MSIEFLIEKYPLTLKLRDGTPVVVRPLQRSDAAKLHKFFLTVPAEERLCFKQRITERSVVDAWCRKLDPQEDFTLVMLDGAKIIGEATLHQPVGGWKRHIGQVNTLTHPDYRGRDVVKILGIEIVDAARQLGLRRLESELNGERSTAIRALEGLNFRQLMRIPDYVMDMEARTHDYVLLGMELTTDEEYAAAG